AADAGGPVLAGQPAAEASGATDCAGSAIPPGTPGADQARVAAAAAGEPRRSLGIAVAAVAVQDPAGLAVRAGRRAVGAVAGQRTPDQPCSPRRLGGAIRALRRVHRLYKLRMKRSRPRAELLELLAMAGKQ